MKKIIFLIPLILFGCLAQAQEDGGFILLPAASTLPPGGKMKLYVKYIAIDGTPSDALGNDIVSWNVNGHAINALTPDDGNLTPDLTLSSATYIAPVATDKNPVAVSVTLKSRTGKGTIILVCNVTVLKAAYKITMDAENTVPNAGRDIKLHGECYANLKNLADGTYILEPIDKTRNMNITVEKGESVNADGAMGELTTPLQYTIPFLFTIGKIDKSLSSAHAIVYLNTTSPQKGKVTWVYTADNKTVTNIIDIDKGTITYIPGKTIEVPGAAGSLYALDNVTNLNLLTNLMIDRSLATKNINQNITNAQDQMAFAKRMQAHMNDPNYFKTPQGKKDMQQMQLLQQQIGGNVVNESSTTKKINAEIAQKIKDDPNYVNSAQFHQDMGKLQMNSIADKDLYQKSAMAEVSPGSAMVRIEGDFDTNSTDAFTESLQKSIGPMSTSVKITVEKIE